jgi:hypothetical protein
MSPSSWAAQRTQWLIDLSAALDEVRSLVTDLEIGDDRRAFARDLYFRIDAARFEVKSLLLSRSLNLPPGANPGAAEADAGRPAIWPVRP